MFRDPQSFGHFKACQQKSVGLQVRVSHADFRSLAGLDSRCHMSKVAVLLHHYVSNLPTQMSGVYQQNASSRVVMAGKINSKLRMELEADPKFLMTAESFLVSIFKHYMNLESPDINKGKVLEARTQLFVQVGRILWKGAAALSNASAVGVDQTQRDSGLAKATLDSWASCESIFRKALLEAGAKADLDKIVVLHPPKNQEGEGTRKEKEDESKMVIVKKTEGESLDVNAEGKAVLCADELFRRLGVEGLNTVVQVREKATIIPHIEGEDAPEPALSQPETVDCTLVLLDLPKAQIMIGQRLYWVHTDELKAKKTEAQEKKELEPAVADPGEAILSVNQLQWEGLENPWYLQLTSFAIAHTHFAVAGAMNGLAIHCFSEEGKPYALQVRATKRIKKNELWLNPFGGKIVSSTDNAASLTPGAIQKMIHPSLVHKAWAKTTGVVEGRRIPRPDEVSAHDFTIMSPLLFSKKNHDVLQSLSPFWAVPRCGRAIGGNFNVVMRSRIAKMPLWCFAPTDVKRPSTCSKHVIYKVCFQVISNPEAIEEGEVLCLPYYDLGEEYPVPETL